MSRTNRGAQIVLILMMLAALTAVVLLKRQCGHAVGNYFDTLEQERQPGSQPTAPPK